MIFEVTYRNLREHDPILSAASNTVTAAWYCPAASSS